jgi:hypothetical protein
MQKRGLEATGILANMSKAAGFSSVSDLLQKNPGAKRPPSACLGPSQPKVGGLKVSCRSICNAILPSLIFSIW